MASKGDWVKAIRNHRGHLVQVTVMRNKQEQVLTMSAGKLKNK
jgi:serine protease Do